MDYKSFKSSLTILRREMNVPNVDIFLKLYLLPLCDVLGKDKADSNVRSMKIRSVLGPYTRSNDVKNALVSNEKFLYTLFSSYTRLSFAKKGTTTKVDSRTKASLIFRQLRIMFQDFELTPHEYSVATLEREFRASLIDSKSDHMIDESSFQYILLSLGSESILDTKVRKKIDSGTMIKGLKSILRAFDTCSQGREVFAQRFKLPLPPIREKKKR